MRGLTGCRLEVVCESRGQSCLKVDLFSGDGMEESQKLGVQEVSSVAWEAGQMFQRLAV